MLAMRAYRQALAAGDINLASKAGATLVRSGGAPPDTALLAIAIALGNKDGAGAQRALGQLSSGPLSFMAPALGAWLAVNRGADPRPVLEKARSNALASRYAALAEPMLTGAGRADVRAGVAALLTGFADDISGQDLGVLSIVLTRSALLLDPAADQARILLADALSRGGSHALALAELDQVRPASQYLRAAEAGRVGAYRRAGRVADALTLARTLAGREDATTAEFRGYADTLAEAGQFDKAATAYAAAIARSDGTAWELHLAQGKALDRAGRWDAALPALRRAVALGNEEAEALETLGEALVRHGGNLAEAQALLERARKLQPDDASIADALAWAYFAAGDTARAVPLLEEAVKGDPAGARVNEHLGDAYWRQGRRYEARYAWSAAALHADAEGAARLQGKMANGIN
ncbi:MAG: tetratricopeptide repeat protein [Sphingomonadales bacterium]|nr:MAG: tetratricopeptide repeat protein [Sphingomonadales bacterium]